jgi:hypothetical protein
MWEAREPQSIIQAAEKAAAAGSFTSAEKLLREAARLQEASLGPRHPDLANTLNNLGIVCEMTCKYDDAEQYFRRAVSIARTSLPPEHPFVATSQNNLRDFCETRGKTVEPPAAAPPPEPREDTPPAAEVNATAAEPEPAAPEEIPAEAHPTPAPLENEPAVLEEVPAPLETATAALDAAPSSARDAVAATDEKPAAPHTAILPALEDPVLTSKKFFYRMALGALGPIAMLMVVLAVGLPRLGPQNWPRRHEMSARTRQLRPRQSPPRHNRSLRHSPWRHRSRLHRRSRLLKRPRQSTPPGPSSSERVSAPRSMHGRADPADRPVPPGPCSSNTQIKSPSATTIQHVGIRAITCAKAVDLRIEANQSAGTAQFSRYLMQLDSGWQLESRGQKQDGALLDEERFEVR